MKFVKEQLQENITVFKSLLKNEDEDFILWKQTPEKWCLLEILCHLYDEERDDFRFRVQWVLERPNEIPPSFNPLNWLEEHNYMEQNYETMLNKFIREREQSINWLESLNNVNWDHSFDHPKAGTMTAKYFLNNWLAHDYLHMKQIVKLKFDYLKQRSVGGLDYAGLWT